MREYYFEEYNKDDENDAEELEAIAAMALTDQYMNDWMDENTLAQAEPPLLPQGNMPDGLLGGMSGAGMSAGTAPGGMPSGLMPFGISPQIMPEGFPGGIMPSGVPGGMMPSGVPGGTMPSGVPSGIMPSGVPGGIMPSGVPSGMMPSGFPGEGPPSGVPRGRFQQRPSGPPPYSAPRRSQAPNIGVYAVETGAIRPCLYRYVYIWLNTGEQFWAWLVFVGRRSAAGWRWTGFRWVYFGVDLRNIESFICY